MLRHRLFAFGSLVVVGSLALAVATAGPGAVPAPKPKAAVASGRLVINAKYDRSITADPKGAAIRATIGAALGRYQSAFSVPVTVNITFVKGPVGLGGSSTFGVFVRYTDYLKALNNAKVNNPSLARALATLPKTTTNPVNNNASVRLSTANARALGFAASPPAGQPDSTITLNTDIMNITRTSIDPGKYDLLAVVSHEIDEALGFGSALNNLKNGDPAPTGPVQPDDLYRYSQAGARSFNTALSTQAFYSIDGGRTKLARFNQQQGGDFSDWFSPGNVPHTPQVQDAFSTPGAIPNLGVELTRLAVLGYTPAGGSATRGPRVGAAARLAGTGRLKSRPAGSLKCVVRVKPKAGGRGR
jgi:hypothetical protein